MVSDHCLGLCGGMVVELEAFGKRSCFSFLMPASESAVIQTVSCPG